MSAAFYVTGGTLRADAECYVRRRADEELYSSLGAGDYCYLLTSRQMGKSSLMVRTARRLAADGAQVAVLDLTSIGQNLTPEQWYEGLLLRLAAQVDRTGDLEIEMEDRWAEGSRLGPLHRFMAALEEEILPFVERNRAEAESPTPPRLVIFVDEIDAVRSLPFSADEFFAAIRECYNRRSLDPRFGWLTFCLIGVATPTDLIQDTRITPFNIGRRIDLFGFARDEAAPLLAGLTESESVSARAAADLMDRVFYWTGGHPYLTQRLCQAVAECDAPTTDAVDRLCSELFLSPAAQDRDDNLLFVRERLLRGQLELASVLDLYGRVLRGERVAADQTSDMVGHLRLSGIVAPDNGRLCVANRIYQRVFDRKWIIEHMPDAELRRQRAAYRRGYQRAGMLASLVVAVILMLLQQANWARQEAVRNARDAGIATERAVRQAERRRQVLVQLQETLGLAQSATARAESSATAARRDRARAESSRRHAEEEGRRARESARRAALQERLARAAGVRERRAALEALELLARGQAERGVEQLVQGRDTGLLDLLEACRTAERIPSLHERLRDLWFAWYRQTAGGLVRIVGGRGSFFGIGMLPGGRCCSAGPNGALEVWDLSSGRLVTTVPPFPGTGVAGPTEPIAAFRASSAIGASPDGRQLARAGPEAVELWNIGPPAVLTGKLPVPDAVLSYSADGREIMTLALPLTGKPILQRWETSTCRPVGGAVVLDTPVTGQSLRSGGSPAPSMSASGGRVVLHELQRDALRVFDCRTGRAVGRPMTTSIGRSLLRAAISDDAATFAVSQEHGVRVWALDTGEPRATIDQRLATALAFTPDGKSLAVASIGGGIRLFDVASGRPASREFRLEEIVVTLSVSQDSRFLMAGGLMGGARVFALGAPQEGDLLAGTEGTRHIELSPKGRYLYRSTAAPQAGRFLHTLPDMKPLRAPEPSPGGTAFSFSEDDRHLCHVGTGQMLRVWSLPDMALKDTASGVPAGISVVRFLAGGRLLAGVGSDRNAAIWTFESGKLGPVRRFRLPSWFVASPGIHQISPDGARLLQVEGSVLRQVHPGDGRIVGPDIPAGTGLSLAGYIHDLEQVLVLNSEGVALHSAATGRRLRHWRGASFDPTSALSPNGRCLFIVHRSGPTDITPEASLLDLETGQTRRVPPATGGPMNRALFSPDSRLVVLSGLSARLSLLRTRDGRPHLRPIQLPSNGLAVAFSGDGKLLATVCMNNTLQVWDVETGLQAATLDLGFEVVEFPPGTGLRFLPGKQGLAYCGTQGRLGLLRLHGGNLDLRSMQDLSWVAVGGRLAADGGIVSLDSGEWERLRSVAAATTAARIEPPPSSTTRPPVAPAAPLFEIPDRAPGTPAQLLDLSAVYNAGLTQDWHRGAAGNNLRNLPSGVQVFGSRRFDVRGIVQLAGQGLSSRNVTFPRAVEVPVGRAFRSLHLLLGAAYTSPDGARIGSVIFHFEAGHRWEVPLRYGTDVRDWWTATDTSGSDDGVVWRGSNRASPAERSLRLYLRSFDSPHPGGVIDRIELRSAEAVSAPFFLGATVE